MVDQAETLRKLMQSRSDAARLRGITFGLGPRREEHALVLQLAATAAGFGLTVHVEGVDDQGLCLELEKGQKVTTGAHPFVFLNSRDSGLSVESSIRPRNQVLILGPVEKSIEQCAEDVRSLRKESGVTEFGIIVNSVTDGSRGLEVFRILQDRLKNFSDSRLDYLGHCTFSDENNLQGVRNGKILLDLETGKASRSCLELLTKRLLAKYAGDLQWDAELYVRRPLTITRFSSRFTEEPAQVAPGNTARVSRNLLAR